MRAVLWDLDGTLLDPRGSIRETIRFIIDEDGLEPVQESEIFIGMPLRDILATRTEDAARIERLVRRFREHFLQETWRLAQPVPGVLEVVRALHADGWPQAIVTTKGQEEAEVLLERTGLASWFGAVVGDDDARPVKPDPAPVLEACRRLGVPPSEAIMIGDTHYDVDAGRAAGTQTIGVLWGHGDHDRHAASGANAIVADARELAAAIRRT